MTRTRNALAIAAVILLASVGCAASWENGSFSDSPEAVKYGTHDWVAQHALDWLPTEERAWLDENLNYYLYGTELPGNGRAPDGIGDTTLHHVYFSRAGELIDDSAARRVQEKFDAAVSLLALGSVAEAAKRAGAMAHYIADLAVWGHVMGAETDWGAEEHHSDFERDVAEVTSRYDSEWSAYLAFDGSLDIISAYDATILLAKETTFGGGGLGAEWLDDHYDWGDERFRGRVIELLNLAVNLVADSLHTLYATSVGEGEWIPAALEPGWVTVDISVARVATANVTITFPSSGFKVVDWGEPVKENGRFVVDIEVRKWTGVSLPVLSPTSHTYELGELEPGSYEFIVRSAGFNVASARFTVEGLAPLANTLLVATGVAAVAVVALILARRARLISPGGEE